MFLLGITVKKLLSLNLFFKYTKDPVSVLS
jgi:hypothetical protein